MIERDLFAAALTIADPVERDAFLASACLDAGQEESIRALLRAEPGLGSFLESPAVAPVLASGTSGVVEAAGAVIGPYKLLEEIGEGGMGVVFMAEQTRHVSRRVALKVIKPGMDSRHFIARFEAERQALALMDHLNIARVLDAGTTDSGRPYFVMELVCGVPITEYCDKNRLDAARRLALFSDVCLAIQHAHQKGIIHRDVKPSNVMVTLHDGVPVVKVIDFGVAKATARRLTEKTYFTAYGQMIGTPAYMSPEQAEMSGLDVDTRSDIYSLGVLLYELLTGTTPIDPARFCTAAFAEMQRLIREEDTPRPSTRLSSLGETATAVAESRGTDPGRLAKLLAGDLDWILMKALEKDRNRRYDSPGRFAEDIGRYLRSEAILARPPSATYRLSRFVRKYRGSVLAGATVALGLLLGSAVATWQAITATRAKRDAFAAAAGERRAKETAEARDAETRAVLEFVERRIFAAARPEGQAGGLGREVTLRRALEAALSHVDGGFADRPLIEARLRGTLGNSFLYLGEARIAADQHERAHALYAERLGPDHPDALQNANDLAVAYRALGRYPKAFDLYRETLSRREAALGPDDPKTLDSKNNLATILDDLGHHGEALKLREETLARRRVVRPPGHPDTIASMRNLANSYAAFSRHEEALKLDEETLALATSTFGPDQPDTLGIRNNLALSYAGMRRFDEALRLQEGTVALLKTKLGPDHPFTLVSMHNMAKALADLGRYEEAVKLNEETLALQKIKPGPEHPETLQTMYSLANHLGSLHRYAEALKWHGDALALRKAKLGPTHRDTLFSMWGVAANLVKLGRGAEAVPIIDECLELAAGSPLGRRLSGLADLRLEYFEEAKDASGCRATAELWEKGELTDPGSLYSAARYRAVTAAVLRATDRSPDGPGRADADAARAMAWLRLAVVKGFKDAAVLGRDKALNDLRNRADFRELIAELEAK